MKTIRVLSLTPRGRRSCDKLLTASPVSDMEVALSWQPDAARKGTRATTTSIAARRPVSSPTLLNLVERPAAASCTDRPQLNYGGWINNRLEPETTYYYRVAAVDRWNNRGPVVRGRGRHDAEIGQKHMAPLRVECLRAILVSPIAPYRFVNLLFRTNCEPDIVRYEVHRSTRPGFTPDDSNAIGTVEADAVIKGSTEYGHTPADYRVREFDHAMYEDDSVLPDGTYYYRVRAVDRPAAKARPRSKPRSASAGDIGWISQSTAAM